jgi:hypothetical protein
MTFPCAGTDPEWHLTESRIMRLAQTFRTPDILAACGRALEWVKAHPKERKTATDMATFLQRWLADEQKRG